MNKKILSVFSVILCMMMLFTACGKKKTEKDEEDGIREKLDSNENLVAFVDDVPVTWDDYNLMYKLSYDQMSQYSQSYGDAWYNAEIDDDGTTMGTYMKNVAIDSITELVAVEKLAEEHGVTVEKEYVEEQMEMIRQQQGGDEGYESFLEDYRTTDEAVRKYIERAELYNRLTEKLSSEGGAAYADEEKLLAEFGKKYVRVQHILIEATFPEDGGDDTEALNKANEVIKKLDEGADFDSLIEEYNEDPGMTKGNYYTFTDGTMVAEFEDASKKLQAGEYTKAPVKTDFGYHIIKKYEVTADCEEFTTFKNEYAHNIISEMLQKKIDSMEVVKKDDEIDRRVGEWMKDLGVNISEMPENTDAE